MVDKVTDEDFEDIDLDDIDLDDIDLEDLEDDLEEEEIEEEKKASFGVNASIPDPVTKGSTKRPQDNTQGDKLPPRQGNSPKTKTEMLSLTMAKLSSMPKAELTAAYKTLMNPTKGEGVIMQGSSKLREALEVSAVDFDLSEDIDALFQWR
jgi:hypothetical protein